MVSLVWKNRSGWCEGKGREGKGRKEKESKKGGELDARRLNVDPSGSMISV